MDMKNMMLSKSEAKDMMPTEAKMDTPKYPYGLRLELNDETMKKLGLNGLPDVGEVMMLCAKVVVERVSQNDTAEGGKRQDMSLQITEMMLEEGDAETKDDTPMEQKLYNTDGSEHNPNASKGKTLLVDL
jgi:hypothetical protein